MFKWCNLESVAFELTGTRIRRKERRNRRSQGLPS